MSICIYKDFIDNKYYRLYMKLLSVPDDTSSYTEVHHILPRSLGGLDEPENLVRITARKHFLAHYLLTKFTIQNSNAWHSMIKAFSLMAANSTDQNRYINSRLYEANRKHMSSTMSVLQSGEKNSQFGTMWIHNHTLRQNKKIKKDEIIPDGWVKGRFVENNNHYTKRKCTVCSKIGCMTKLSSFCSVECFKLNASKYAKLNKINKEDFISEYVRVQSLRKATKSFNIMLGSNNEWCREVILNSGNFEAICIYMRNKKGR